MKTIPAPDERFLTQLASTNAVPAGGAALAYASAMAAALVMKAAQITLGKSSYVHVHEQAKSIAHSAEILRTKLLLMLQEDCSAFENYLAARRASPHQPDHIISTQLQIIETPLQIAQLSLDVLSLATQIATIGYINVSADAIAAANLAYAALNGSLLNAKTNLKQNETLDSKQQYHQKFSTIENSAHLLFTQIQQGLAE